MYYVRGLGGASIRLLISVLILWVLVTFAVIPFVKQARGVGRRMVETIEDQFSENKENEKGKRL